MTANSAPGFRKYPDHRITTKPADSYFSLQDGPENAVWSYEQPYEEMSGIRDLLAFYPDKVDSITARPQ